MLDKETFVPHNEGMSDLKNDSTDIEALHQSLDCLKKLPTHIVSDEAAQTVWNGGVFYDALAHLKKWVHRLERETVWWDIERAIHDNQLSKIVITQDHTRDYYRVEVSAYDAAGQEIDIELTESLNGQMDGALEEFLDKFLDEPIQPENLEQMAAKYLGHDFVAKRHAAALERQLPEASPSEKPPSRPRV